MKWAILYYVAPYGVTYSGTGTMTLITTCPMNGAILSNVALVRASIVPRLFVTVSVCVSFQGIKLTSLSLSLSLSLEHYNCCYYFKI